MILVLGGTTEARELLDKLIDKGVSAIVSTAYAYADKFIPQHQLIEHISGRLDAKDLERFIKKRQVSVVVDATHPYAAEISTNAKAACGKAGIGYIRYERGITEMPDVEYGNVHYVGSPQEAAKLACKLGERIFVATGSTTARAFRSTGKKQGCKIYVRVLPEDNSLRKCRVAGYTEDEIITGIGPFSYVDNFELWQRLAIDVVVTKDSGLPGGFSAKVNAARDLGINLIVIRRPSPSEGALTSADEVIKALSDLNAV